MHALKHCRDRRHVLPIVLRALLCWALHCCVAVAFCGPSLPPPAAVPSPLDFAPSPFALPGSKPPLDKQVSNLLKHFDAIASGEVIVSGEPGSNLSVQIVIEPRAGARLDPPTLQSLVTLIASAAPGLQPRRLNIASSDGRMLVRDGAVVDEPSRTTSSHDFVNATTLAIAALALLLGGYWALRQRRPDNPEGLDSLVLQRHRQIAEWLRHERPELAGVVVWSVGARAARRLQRSLKAQGVPVTPAGSPDPAACQLLRQALLKRFKT